MAKSSSINQFKYKKTILDNWTECPHCHREIRIYLRNLQWQHALCLYNLYRLGQNSYHHYSEFSPEGFTDYGKLALWGLAESQVNTEEPKKLESGNWKLTYKGIEFLLGRCQIDKYILTYNNDIIPPIDTDIEVENNETVSFKDLAEAKFDYRETLTKPETLALFSGII